MKISSEAPRDAGKPEGGASDLARLSKLIGAFTPHEGSFELKRKGVHAIRRSHTSPELVHGIQRSALCIVAQGAKSVMLGQDLFEYDAARMIAFSVDLPVASRVTRASLAEPFLCLRLDLDPQMLAPLVLKVFPHGLPKAQDSGAVCVAPADPRIINATLRLVELMAQPDELELLAPLAVDEILIRLLRSPVGARIAQIGLVDTGLYGVEKAVSWLRSNFSRPMRVEELAELAHMSPSSFHQHFRSVTSMSPLQYQKALRLQEARNLMLSKMLDASTAGQLVGYASASQFSREYGRFFGKAPSKDIASLREKVGMGSAE
ncbi:MAG TPA: AraC family transcriptional regulator [Rectinemataceae bacterium]|nr:AraC family transcriptional regulator [Rectinemataceae bacterium]